MNNALQRIWYGRSWLKWLLWPFSIIYLAVIQVRALLYRTRFLSSVRCARPVIIVGNITTGGMGKTPFCIALCELLKQQGYRPGLVSRGYGGKSTHWPQVVTATSDPRLVGDESVLLVQRTQCPMVVAPDRVAAVKRLLTDYDCDLVVSDDGLQHYRLARDIEIVLWDKERMGNGCYLPAGPLRESMHRLSTVDFVLDQRHLTVEFYPVHSIKDPNDILTPQRAKNHTICAVAGIGHPERFFEALSELGFVFERKIFKDHYNYQESDILSINADIIIMTEKDSVKCQVFCDKRCYILKMRIVLDQVCSLALLQRIKEIS